MVIFFEGVDLTENEIFSAERKRKKMSCCLVDFLVRV